MPIFYTLTGQPIKLNLSHYKIDWEAKSPSNFQFSVKQFLKPYWSCDIGVCEELVIPKSGKLRVDLINFQRKIAIETSGQQHFEYNKFFHGGNIFNFSQSIKRDDKKRTLLEKNGFSLIEIIEEDVPKLSPKFIKEKFGVDII